VLLSNDPSPLTNCELRPEIDDPQPDPVDNGIPLEGYAPVDIAPRPISERKFVALNVSNCLEALVDMGNDAVRPVNVTVPLAVNDVTAAEKAPLFSAFRQLSHPPTGVHAITGVMIMAARAITIPHCKNFFLIANLLTEY
jgi:hypothetical protein